MVAAKKQKDRAAQHVDAHARRLSQMPISSAGYLLQHCIAPGMRMSNCSGAGTYLEILHHARRVAYPPIGMESRLRSTASFSLSHQLRRPMPAYALRKSLRGFLFLTWDL
jgi:hypothetical protein